MKEEDLLIKGVKEIRIIYGKKFTYGKDWWEILCDNGMVWDTTVSGTKLKVSSSLVVDFIK